MVLRLSLVSMSWSYLPKLVFNIFPTILHINIMFSFRRHEVSDPSCHCRKLQFC